MMKKQLKLLIITIIMIFSLSSCIFDKEDKKSDSINQKKETQVNKKDNIKEKSEKENKKVAKTNKEKNSEGRHIEPTIKVKSKSDRKLSQIEEEIREEQEKKKEELNKKRETVKSTLKDYFGRVNTDQDIIDLIDKKSIIKIKKNTEIVYNALSDEEKKQFIKELREYGFTKKDFDPTNISDIYKYINFVVKAGYRLLGENQGIKKVEFSNFTEIKDTENGDDVYYIQTELTFNNRKTKTLKMFLNKDFKVIIAN